MKTNLNRKIESRKQAIEYLNELHSNGEAYHCDDNAFEIIWDLPTEQQPTDNECFRLNELMEQVHVHHEDPCEVILLLSETEEQKVNRENDEREYIQEHIWTKPSIQRTLHFHLTVMKLLEKEGNYYANSIETTRKFIDMHLEKCDPRKFSDMTAKEKLSAIMLILEKYNKPC